LAPPAALLAGALGVARLLGPNIVTNFLAAALTGSASVVLGYLFSEDWRKLILAQLSRARVLVGSLTHRAKPIPPVNTNAHK
jgi:hypothetical protein